MPIDKRGTRAEIIMDGASIVNRLNPARLLEQYLNGVLDSAWERIKVMTANGECTWDFITTLYRLMSPSMYEKILKHPDPEAHKRTVLQEGFYIHMPTDNPVDTISMCNNLEMFCPPLDDRVTYKLASGEVVETADPVTIADQYFILLEKIGDDYSSVASPVVQPQGVPGKLTRTDKYSSPGRPQAIRGIGETEMRILNTMTDIDVVSDMLDVANSPSTHRHVCERLLTADQPTNIENIIDRNVTPRGNNRVTQGVANSLLAGGYEIVYRPVEED